MIKPILKWILFLVIAGIMLPLVCIIASIEIAKNLSNVSVREYLQSFGDVVAFSVMGYLFVLGFIYIFWAAIYCGFCFGLQKSSMWKRYLSDAIFISIICIFSASFFIQFANGEGWHSASTALAMTIPAFILSILYVRQVLFPKGTIFEK